MNFEFFVSSAAVTAIAAVLSAIISALVAKRTAEITANKEIEKLKLSWAREDAVASDADFSEMSKSVAMLLHYDSGDLDMERDAVGKIAFLRAREGGELGYVLDQLQTAVNTSDFEAADRLLSSAITLRREKSAKRPGDS